MLARGSRWRVGDGRHIRVWGDAWYPDEDPRIHTLCVEGLRDLKVRGLMDMEGRGCDMEVARDLLGERDVNLLSTISVSRRGGSNGGGSTILECHVEFAITSKDEGIFLAAMHGVFAYGGGSKGKEGGV